MNVEPTIWQHSFDDPLTDRVRIITEIQWEDGHRTVVDRVTLSKWDLVDLTSRAHGRLRQGVAKARIVAQTATSLRP